MEKIVIDSGFQPTHAIIWLHGLGADGHDFESFATELPQLVSLPKTRFIFPHAPIIPVTVNGGSRMRAWYDIVSPDLSQQEDEASLLAAVAQVDAMLEALMDDGVPAKNVILGGFSQGGAVSLLSLARLQKKLAAVVCLSGYMPLIHQFLDQTLDVNQTTPVFVAHGKSDGVVPEEAADVAVKLLSHKKFPFTYKKYDISHNICPKEIQELAQFVSNAWS